jgi:glutaredoxin 3
MPPNLKIDIYTSRFDPECIRAKGLLDRCGVDYNEFDVDRDEFHREIMRKRSGGRTSVPQVFINGQAIGGYEGLEGYLASQGSQAKGTPGSSGTSSPRLP